MIFISILSQVRNFNFDIRYQLFVIVSNLINFVFIQAIAAKYPELSISTVLMAEKKFADADADRSGVCILYVLLEAFLTS